MCSSLYERNESLLKLYTGLEVVQLQSTETVETISLDTFRDRNGINAIDFVKIDIQGAELDVFKGAMETLRDVCAIMTEVEFIPLYKDQPLFGDVCAFLSE